MKTHYNLAKIRPKQWVLFATQVSSVQNVYTVVNEINNGCHRMPQNVFALHTQ